MTDQTSDRDLLVKVHTTLENLNAELMGGEGREGRIPRMEGKQDQHAEDDHKRFSAIDKQLSYYKGAIAFGGFLIVVFGAVILDHILRSTH